MDDNDRRRVQAALAKMTNWQNHQWCRFVGKDRNKRRDPSIAERFAKLKREAI